MSDAVGSIPSFTRSGSPRSIFLRSSGSEMTSTAFAVRRRSWRSTSTAGKVTKAGSDTGRYPSDAREDVLARAEVDARLRLDVEARDDAVLEHGCIALRPQAQTYRTAVELETHRLGELAVAVGEHQDLVADALFLAPGVHDPGVVHRDAGDASDALLEQLVGALD